MGNQKGKYVTSSSVTVGSPAAAAHKLSCPQRRHSGIRAPNVSLSEHQMQIIVDCWPKMNAVDIGNAAFKMALIRAPTLKQVFQSISVIEGVFGYGQSATPTLHQHGQLLGAFLVRCIEFLSKEGCSTSVCLECQKVGKLHAKYAAYGLRAEHWDIFGEFVAQAAIERAHVILRLRHRELARAWTTFSFILFDQLRQGFELERRNLRCDSETGTPELEKKRSAIRYISSTAAVDLEWDSAADINLQPHSENTPRRRCYSSTAEGPFWPALNNNSCAELNGKSKLSTISAVDIPNATAAKQKRKETCI